MPGVTRLTQLRAGIWSSTFSQQSKIRDAAAYAKLSKIRWAAHVVRLNDYRWTRAVSDWTPLDVKRTTGRHRRDGQTFSRSPSKKETMLSVSYECTEAIGQFWSTRRTSGGIAGARWAYPKVNGSQGDQGDACRIQSRSKIF
ncbi:hypothetical protein ANCDUO_25319 [Ancylostoma duodenale]|uniref:Uncharacterized protein n=1 Tax=Ancylostoma duodenale TaxID=51022 RepID=A0A0C2F814_9BILA|nr:hypothetical protein ANCDUO_25319 [Ancylostoma duodenale]